MRQIRSLQHYSRVVCVWMDEKRCLKILPILGPHTLQTMRTPPLLKLPYNKHINYDKNWHSGFSHHAASIMKRWQVRHIMLICTEIPRHVSERLHYFVVYRPSQFLIKQTSVVCLEFEKKAFFNYFGNLRTFGSFRFLLPPLSDNVKFRFGCSGPPDLLTVIFESFAYTQFEKQNAKAENDFTSTFGWSWGCWKASRGSGKSPRDVWI